MKKQIHRRFLPQELSECPWNVKNPARGWYRIYSFLVEKEPDFNELEWCLDREDTLAFVFLDIGACRDRSLTEEELLRIRRILEYFIKNGYDIILRVAYDHEGRALEREPGSFERVLEHLSSIGELLLEFGHRIFVYQGMLVGSWGEMHSSRFLEREQLLRLGELLASFQGSGTYFAVRRPSYWRLLHPDGEGAWKKGRFGFPGRNLGRLACRDCMGLFDDGIFGSESHLGTFSAEEGPVFKKKAPGTEALQTKGSWMEAQGKPSWTECAWTLPWSRREELYFENVLCTAVPNGGEAVFSESFGREQEAGRILQDMRKMHLTYLNKEHDIRLLNQWKNWKSGCRGAFSQCSFQEYIGAHLGYRLVIKKVSFRKKGIQGGAFLLKAVVENTGFAPLYQEARCFFEILTKNGERQILGEPAALTGLGSGERLTLTCLVAPEADALTEGEEIFLRAERVSDGAVIRFANHEGKEITRLGRLTAG